MERSDLHAEGNRLYREGSYRESLELFMQLLDSSEELDTQHVAYMNSAACLLSLSNHSEAINMCTKAIEIKNHSKARYRRAIAYLNLGMLTQAKADLDEANKLCPNNHAIEKEYMRYVKLLKDQAGEPIFSNQVQYEVGEEKVIEEYED